MLNVIKKKMRELIEGYRYEINDHITRDAIKANINLIMQDVNIPYKCVSVIPTEDKHNVIIDIERRS